MAPSVACGGARQHGDKCAVREGSGHTLGTYGSSAAMRMFLVFMHPVPVVIDWAVSGVRGLSARGRTGDLRASRRADSMAIHAQSNNVISVVYQTSDAVHLHHPP
jgi:hypothetical protein